MSNTLLRALTGLLGGAILLTSLPSHAEYGKIGQAATKRLAVTAIAKAAQKLPGGVKSIANFEHFDDRSVNTGGGRGGFIGLVTTKRGKTYEASGTVDRNTHMYVSSKTGDGLDLVRFKGKRITGLSFTPVKTKVVVDRE